eukprot:scaffold7738_cov133-Cylindrotheca_fusiformis.AAC.15
MVLEAACASKNSNMKHCNFFWKRHPFMANTGLKPSSVWGKTQGSKYVVRAPSHVCIRGFQTPITKGLNIKYKD